MPNTTPTTLRQEWLDSLRRGDAIAVEMQPGGAPGQPVSYFRDTVQSTGFRHITGKEHGKLPRDAEDWASGPLASRWRAVPITTAVAERFEKDELATRLAGVHWAGLPLEVLRRVAMAVDEAGP